MPTYSYQCPTCTNKFDKLLPMSNYKTPQSCSRCGSIATKVMSIGGIQDDSPAWLNQSVRNQLQDTDSHHIPIETRTQYRKYLKDNCFAPTS